jgi:hypothetical protein
MFPTLTERAKTWFAVLVLVCGLTAHLLLARQGWAMPGMLGHGFRQAQTALTIETLRQDGFRLDYETPVLGKPWSIPMEFPLYQWLAAELGRATGWPTVQAGRAVSLATFYLGLPALWLLLRSIGAGRGRACMLLLPVLATPVYVFYSRAVLIESLAWAASAWFLACAWRWHRGGGLGWLAGAWCAGTLAALVKGTTWAVFLVPLAVGLLAGAWRAEGGGRWIRGLATALRRGLLLVGPPLVVGLLWVAYADRVKAENPLAAFLTSGHLALFNFGTLAERCDPAFWREIGGHWARTSMPWWALLAGAVGFVATVPRWRWAALALLGGFLAGPLVFANLYQIHDYYHYATAGFIAVAAGMVWLGVSDRGGWWRWLGWAVFVAAPAGQGLTYWQEYHAMQVQPFEGTGPLATEIRQLTRPQDVIVVHGTDWSSELPFYAQRRALVIPDGQQAIAPEAVEANIRRLHDEPVALVVFLGAARERRELIERRIRDFALWPTPLFSVGEAEVYAAESDLVRMTAIMRTDTPASGVQFHGGGPTVAVSPDVQPLGARRFAGAFPDYRPTPERGVLPFGYILLNENGRRLFVANVPTELYFPLPAEAHRVALTYGVYEEAFSHAEFGGIRFVVELRTPGSVPVVLLDDWIGAAEDPAEAGHRKRELVLPAGATGEVVFRTLPGPDGNGAYGWGLLRQFEIR